MKIGNNMDSEKYTECVEDILCCYHLLKKYIDSWEILTLLIPIIQMVCNNMIEFFKKFDIDVDYFTNKSFSSQFRVGYKFFSDIKDIKQRYIKLLNDSLENNIKNSKCQFIARLIADNYCIWFVEKYPILSFSLASHLYLLNSEDINLYNHVEIHEHAKILKKSAYELGSFLVNVLKELNIESECIKEKTKIISKDYRIINKASFLKGKVGLYDGLFLLDGYCVSTFYFCIIKTMSFKNDHLFWDKIRYYLFFNLYIGLKNNCKELIDKIDSTLKYDKLVKNKIRSSIAHYKCLSSSGEVIYESFEEAVNNELKISRDELNTLIDEFFYDYIGYCKDIFDFD